MATGQFSGPLAQSTVPGRKTPQVPDETILTNDRDIGSVLYYAPPSTEFLRESLLKDFDVDNVVVPAHKGQ